MKKVLIVQPHSDDAIFNCGKYILSGKYDVEILTVENDKKRIQEDKNLYNFLQIPFHHLEVEFQDNSYYGFFKKYKGVTKKNSHDYLNEYFGEEVLLDVKKSILKFVKKFRKENEDCIVLAPLGIAHPFHYYVHEVLQDEADLFYREFPHSYKKRSQEQFNACLAYFECKYQHGNLDTHAMKFELSKKFYKSQSGLLFFEQGYIKKELPEEFYVKL